MCYSSHESIFTQVKETIMKKINEDDLKMAVGGRGIIFAKEEEPVEPLAQRLITTKDPDGVTIPPRKEKIILKA